VGIEQSRASPGGADERSGGAVLAEEPKGRSRVVIALADGSTVASDCSQVGACVTPLTLPEAPAGGNGFWTRALSAAAALLGHPPQRYVAAMARGVNPRDGVARLEDGTLDLHAIAGHFPAGEYSVRLDYVPAHNAARVGSPLTASFISPDAALVRAPGLEAGLLEIGVAPEGTPDATTSAWVLAVAPQRYEVATEAFESARLVADRWEGEARARSVRSFLRAYLETLCSSATGERCPGVAR